MTCQISVEAQKDLESIWLYTLENWSVGQADRYISLIFDEIDYLTRNPQSGKDYSHVRKLYRTSKVKSHIIFYKQQERDLGIEIIRILHQSMDIESRLTE